MTFEDYLRGIRTRLIINHGDLLRFFQLDKELLHYRPADGGWTVAEILEHVGLTSYYLLILVDKSANKAIRKASGVDLVQVHKTHEYAPSRLNSIGQHKAFPWARPGHMEPTGTATPEAVMDQLQNQLNRCLNQLDLLRNGEGLLHTTTMTVDDLGRLNVYEYIDFVARHVARHIMQIQQNIEEAWT